MKEELEALYIKSGSLNSLIKYLNEHPDELGTGINKIFREVLQNVVASIERINELNV